MGYYESDKYDVFIAYYGDKAWGSEQKAQEIYEYINNAQITPNKYIRAYFHPAVNPYGSFEETPLIVARTPLFLLVADKNIPTNIHGQLLKHREDGTLRNLFEEVRSFHDSVMYKSIGGDTAAKVFISDDMDSKKAERLHTVFSGKTSLNRYGDVLDWITHFYTHTYIDRLWRKYEYLAQTKPNEFLEGFWVQEAEDVWRSIKSENIGRSLLIYYKIKARQGNYDARRQVWKLEQEFAALGQLEPKTVELLSRAY